MSHRLLFVLSIVSLVLAPTLALAQGQLVPIVTNDTPLVLPGTFGQQSTVVRNETGDVAVLDIAGSAVHLKRTGSSNWTLIIQAGDEVPGLAASRIHAIVALRINASGLLAMGLELNLASGERQSAVVIHNGASLVNVVDGTDTAPNSGGTSFGRGLTLYGLNDSGTVVVTSPLLPEPSQFTTLPTHVFIVPSSESPVRIAGPGDPAPETTTTFQSVGVGNINSNGDVPIIGVLADNRRGLFLGSATSLRKLVLTGDPHPGGGAFTQLFGGAVNNLGRVLFTGFSGTSGGLFVVEPNSTITQLFSNGGPAPIPGGGTLMGASGLAFNDAGTALFEAQVWPNPAGRGIFRIAPGGPVQAVVYVNQPAPGTGTTITNYSRPFMNSSGVAVFLAQGTANTPLAFYSQSGTNQPVPLAFHGGPSGVPGGGTVDLGRSVLGPIFDDGRSLMHLWLAGGTTDLAYLLRSSAGVTSMLLTTNEDLPGGGRTLLSQRSVGVRGSQAFVGFIAMRPGGGAAAFVHDVSSHVTTRVAGDGDFVSGTSDRFRIGTSTSAFVNSAGQVALAGVFYGPAGTRPGIVLASAASGLQKIVVDGDMDAAGFVLKEHGALPFVRSSINSFGHVAFSAVDGQLGGIWVGIAGAPPTKVVKINDLVSNGNYVTNVIGSPLLNDGGQVLFRAATTWQSDVMFLATPGEAFQKIVGSGDPAPGGGTFSDLITGSLNNVGQVAFVTGTIYGGTGGVFVGSTTGPPVAIARNGDPAPGGGTFALESASWGAIINDRSDVLFRSNLSGTGGDSGYFIWRGTAGPVESLVRAGDAAPGTPSTFLTFRHASAVGDVAQLSASGGVTFLGDYSDGAAKLSNYWYVGTTGVVEPVALTVPAAAGGGTVIRTSSTSSWAGARYPIWARMSGGAFVEGVFVFVPPTTAVVGIGSNVQVTPVDSSSGLAPLTVTFASVIGAGLMTLGVSGAGPVLPADYAAGAPLRYYDLTTTATYDGQVTVCINVNDVLFPPGSTIRLLHYSPGGWMDVTTSAVGRVVCGAVTSLSQFTVAGLMTPGSNLVQNGDFSGDLASWSAFATPDGTHIQAAVNAGVLEFYRVPPPPGQVNQAVIFQQTGIAVDSGAPLVATFDLGNSSAVRKRISVLIQDFDFSDLFVCTFWLPPNLPLTTYAVRTHTTKAWANATIAFYAATPGSDGGAYRIDNVSLRPFAAGAADRTECEDPTRPSPPGGSTGPQWLVNGDFEADLPPWGVFGQMWWQIQNGVFEFWRAVGTPAGVVLQPTQQAAAAGEVLTATFELGSTYPVRRRVTVLLHDNDFTDLAACTFWLEPGQPLQQYEMRMFTTKAWSNATVSIYPVAVDWSAVQRLDNVTFRRTPGVTFNGTDCVEPVSSSPASARMRSKKS